MRFNFEDGQVFDTEMGRNVVGLRKGNKRPVSITLDIKDLESLLFNCEEKKIVPYIRKLWFALTRREKNV